MRRPPPQKGPLTETQHSTLVAVGGRWEEAKLTAQPWAARMWTRAMAARDDLTEAVKHAATKLGVLEDACTLGGQLCEWVTALEVHALSQAWEPPTTANDHRIGRGVIPQLKTVPMLPPRPLGPQVANAALH